MGLHGKSLDYMIIGLLQKEKPEITIFAFRLHFACTCFACFFFFLFVSFNPKTLNAKDSRKLAKLFSTTLRSDGTTVADIFLFWASFWEPGFENATKCTNPKRSVSCFVLYSYSYKSCWGLLLCPGFDWAPQSPTQKHNAMCFVFFFGCVFLSFGVPGPLCYLVGPGRKFVFAFSENHATKEIVDPNTTQFLDAKLKCKEAKYGSVSLQLLRVFGALLCF